MFILGFFFVAFSLLFLACASITFSPQSVEWSPSVNLIRTRRIFVSHSYGIKSYIFTIVCEIVVYRFWFPLWNFTILKHTVAQVINFIRRQMRAEKQTKNKMKWITTTKKNGFLFAHSTGILLGLVDSFAWMCGTVAVLVAIAGQSQCIRLHRHMYNDPILWFAVHIYSDAIQFYWLWVEICI